jgi:transcriptional regulator with XRE-family HTH domain
MLYVFRSLRVCPTLPSASMEKVALAKRFGALVRRLRLERGYSQEMFGEVCRIDRTYVGMIERGEVNVTLAMVAKVARGLEISLVDLFAELEGSPDTPNDG